MTQLARTNAPGALAVPGNDQRFGGFSADDMVMPQAHIVQGLPKELDKYGKCLRGDVINTLTLEKLFSYDVDTKATEGDNTFVTLVGFPEWVNWPKGALRPLYKHRDRRFVPASDLEWLETGGNRMPPTASQNFVFIVLFCADPSIPLALTFKKTSIKAGQTLLSLEKLRGGKGPGLYAMTFKKGSNDQGSWIAPVITPKGNPTPEMFAMATEMASGMNIQNIQVAEEPNADDFVPEGDYQGTV